MFMQVLKIILYIKVSSNYTIYESTPTTYILTAGVDNSEYISFMTRYKEISRGFFSKERVPMKHCTENMWLIKPANEN